jgi:hypothetical protein
MARADGSIPARLALGKTVPLVLVALFGALFTLLLHPVIGLPIAGAALAGLIFGRRTLAALVATLAGGALTAVVASGTLYVVGLPLTGVPTTARAPYVFAAFVVASLVVAGPVTAAAMRRRSAVQTTVLVTAMLTVLQLAVLSSFASGAGQSLGGYMSSAARSLAAQAGMGVDVVATLISMWPGAAVAMNCFTAVFVVAGVGVVGARVGASLQRLPALTILDLDPRAAVLPIAAIALIAAGRLPFGAAPTLEIVGKNLLVVARWVFFFQGLAVFAGLYQRAKFARPVRTLGFVLAGVTEALFPGVSLLGLADIWLNLRRLPRDTSESAELPGATSGEN